MREGITLSQEELANLAELSQQVAFLILKREWMKVWFRNKL
jgi:DNA-binding XRE family transcriptional regulator